MATLRNLREQYHRSLGERIWDGRARPRSNPPVPWLVDIEGQSYPVYTNADKHNPVSVVYCDGVAARCAISPDLRFGQGSTSGTSFEDATSTFLNEALKLFLHLDARRLYTNPPETRFDPTPEKPAGSLLPPKKIDNYAQFKHLDAIQTAIDKDPELGAAIGADYLVAPDILVLFRPFTDDLLNAGGADLDGAIGNLSHLRTRKGAKPILHASVSCKWTMRRDRAQNTRLEALNLVRNRKGRLPHIAAVTMECDPGILGSLSLGTGDIDCVYHGALPELVETAGQVADARGGKWQESHAALRRMTDGSRLRDITDLPLDLLA